MNTNQSLQVTGRKPVSFASNRLKRGFTMMEIMIVIVVIGLLADDGQEVWAFGLNYPERG